MPSFIMLHSARKGVHDSNKIGMAFLKNAMKKSLAI